MVTTKKMEATLYDKLSFNIICGGSHELPLAHSLAVLLIVIEAVFSSGVNPMVFLG